MVDGVCEPIAQWRVSASEPKAREREKVEKDSLGGVVDIVVDGVRTNCVAIVWITGITYALASWCIHLVTTFDRRYHVRPERPGRANARPGGRLWDCRSSLGGTERRSRDGTDGTSGL